MIKSQKSILVVIGLLTTLSSATLTAEGFDGCVLLGRKQECGECFKRKILRATKGCGPLEPKEDRCLLYDFDYARNVSTCNLCKTGSALKLGFNGTRTTKTCVPATIKGCLFEVDIPLMQPSRACAGCADNKYSVVNKTAGVRSCQKIENPIANCRWGSVYLSATNYAECLRC